MITSKDGKKLYRVEIRRVVYVLASDMLDAEVLAEGLSPNPAEMTFDIRLATEKKADSDGWTGHPFYSAQGTKQARTVGELIEFHGLRKSWTAFSRENREK